MGCGNSKQQAKKDAQQLIPNLDIEADRGGINVFLPSSGPLTAKEYKERLVTSNGTRLLTFPHTGYTIKYAFVSQRGYYPDTPDKQNQDSYCVHPCFNADSEQFFMGVFDGHGEFGTACSQFARDKLVENLLKSEHFEVAPELAYHEAMVATNQQLHQSPIDDSMSGTTAIAALIKGNNLFIANVGDSRAVLAERQEGKVNAVDLSVDQTPFRRDECERVKKAGARVLTLDQVEGLKDPTVECWTTEEEDDGDPPRLWFPNGVFPGTAFTRSIGDSAAERIGVFAEPEVVCRQLTTDNPFLILASDGVFEFLSSQSVVDMVSTIDDPLDACMSVVAESYRLWLKWETRTDDITMIVVKFVGLGKETVPFADIPSAKWNVLQGKPRPVVPRPIAGMGPGSPLATSPASRRTPEQLACIADGVRNNFLFTHLSEADRAAVFEQMEQRTVQAGEVVIRQGDRGDIFYIVDSGIFDVQLSIGGKPAEVVHTYTGEPNHHPSFGELALLYSKPRAATVIARTAGSLWCLHRQAFKSALQKREPQLVIRLLRGMKLFRCLTSCQLQQLADAMTVVAYNDGEIITRQGEPSQDFFLISQGEVTCTATIGESAKEVLQLPAGQSFGEQALMHSAPRPATITANGRVVLLTISRIKFESLFGNLKDLVDNHQAWTRQLVQQEDMVMSIEGIRRVIENPNLDPLTLEARALVLYTDTTRVLRMAEPEGSLVATVKLHSIVDVVQRGKAPLIARSRMITRELPPHLFVPHTIKAFHNQQFAGEVLASEAMTTLDGLMAVDGACSPLDEASTRYIAASLVVALEHLHYCNIMYRGLSTLSVVVSASGLVQLMDFRFAKSTDGRTYTLCGLAEYLAPEVVEGTGHTEAVDWWSLGVLIFVLMTGETPFSAPGDDELRIYRKISNCQLQYPSSLSPATCELLSKLLVRSPHTRLGCGLGGCSAIRRHPWFQDIDWAALQSNTLQPPEELQRRLALHKPLVPPRWEPALYTEGAPWLEEF